MTGLSHQSILGGGKYRQFSLQGIEADSIRKLHWFMLRLRRCEQALAAEYHPADEMRCPVHFCVGQEAVPAALHLALRDEDYLFCHHRSHGYYLAKNAPMREMFAELYGKETGANGGKAGSQDISYPARNFFSGAILAGATAIAMGTALAFKLRSEGRVVVAGFGESATDEGIFWETVSYAALCKLPVVFVCENNNYSVFSPQLKRQLSENISERVAAFGVPSTPIFGNDVVKVHAAIGAAVERARSGQGPSFIEAFTYRWSGHYGPESDDLVGYRSKAEIEAWKANCPIGLMEEAMHKAGLLDSASKARALDEIDAEIAEAFHFAKASPFPKAGDWASANWSSGSPLADRLLSDIDTFIFDENQTVAQAKGY